MHRGLLLICFLFYAIATPAATPRSIILLIADGAGVAAFTTARIIRGSQFQTGQLPITGLVATSPLVDSIVTDSAAAATAYATGVSTKYRAVSVDRHGKRLRTVLEVAEGKGKSTGLVTTANFWDATVAAFAAHNASRYETTDIVAQMLSSGAEVIAGGGLQYFGTKERPRIEEVAGDSGYTLIRTGEELGEVDGTRLLAVFETKRHEEDFSEVRLPVLARWALDRVSGDPDGFFLLIEHEGPDGAAHGNVSDKFLASLISFDEAVGVALDYARSRDDVLVLVTGDHPATAGRPPWTGRSPRTHPTGE